MFLLACFVPLFVCIFADWYDFHYRSGENDNALEK